MFWKGPLLPPFILLFLSGIAYNTIYASAQQDSATLLTYTNTDLGFTMKYPSDWTVNESSIVTDHRVRFASTDGIGNVVVEVRNATEEQMTIVNTNDESAKANGVKRLLSPNENLLELDVSRYFLSGHPAIRLVEMVNVQSSPPFDAKGMTYTVFLNGKWYKVGYYVIPPEDFPKYLPTAQSMINSFQIISKQ
jgi:hypothetical protein